MKHWIRWLGLVAFVLLVVITAGVWYFIADDAIEAGIKKGASSANGAQVDIGEFEIGLLPFGFVIENMQFTDPANPARNTIEFERAVLDIDFTQLLLGRLIINDVSVIGVKLDSERQTPGRVNRQATSEDESEVPSLFDQIALPTSERLMAEVSNLETVRQGEQLAVTWQQAQARVGDAIAQLPDQARIDTYDARIERLRATSVDSLESAMALQEEVVQMQAEISDDVLAFAQARIAIATAKAQLERDWQALQAAPSKDWQAMRQAYQLNQQGLENATRLLLGEEMLASIQSVEQSYQQAKPIIEWVLARMPEGGNEAPTGRFITFPSEYPLPSFLLKQASFDIALDSGRYQARLSELTNNQNIRNQATTFSLQASEQAQVGSVTVEAVFDRRDGIDDQISLRTQDWQVPKTQLLDQALLSAYYQDGGGNITGLWQRDESGWQLRGEGRFASEGFVLGGDETWVGRVQQALDQADQASLSLTVSEQQGELSTRIDSNLDDALIGVVNEEVDAALAQAQAEVQAKLNEEIARRRAPYDQGLAQLNDWQAQWDRERQRFESRVEAQLKAIADQTRDYIERQRQQLEAAAAQAQREAQERLDAERQRIEAQRRAREEAARKEAEQTLKDALDGANLPGF